MSDFENLEILLSHLEGHAIEYVNGSGLYGIRSLSETLYDQKKAEGQNTEAERSLWELWTFGLVFTDGDLENWCFHVIARFDERAYTYVRARCLSTKNPFLAAQYAHTLWHGPTKDIGHARRAIDSYLEIVRLCECEDKKSPSGEKGFALTAAARNAYGLAVRTGYRLPDTKAEVLRLIEGFNFASGWSVRLRQVLIPVVLKDKKHFGKAELSGLSEICWRLANSSMKSQREDQFHDAKDLVNLGQKVDQRVGRTSRNWDLQRAKCFERIMRMRSPGDCATAEFCLDAIQNYRKAGKEEKAKALEAQYGSLAGSVQFAHVRTRVDMTGTMLEAHARSEKVVTLNPREVVDFLAHQTDLLPRYDNIKRAISEGAVDPLLMDAPSATIDGAGHLTERCNTAKEREKRETLRLFGQQLGIRYLPIIHEVIVRTIAAERLSIDTLRKYLQQRSWLGKDIDAQSPTRGKYRYRWWDLLEPSLIGYFGKTKQWLADRSHVPNMILEIDSLTLKFEGMLRDLLQRDGVPTFRRKRQDHSLTEERYIGDLLYTDAIERLLGQDDLLFFRFLLSEDSGYDLRNAIAHCQLLAGDYCIHYMHLLFLALLRLSRYDLAQPDELVIGRHGAMVHRACCAIVKRIEPKNRLAFMSIDASRRERCKACKATQSAEKQNAAPGGSEYRGILVMR